MATNFTKKAMKLCKARRQARREAQAKAAEAAELLNASMLLLSIAAPESLSSDDDELPIPEDASLLFFPPDNDDDFPLPDDEFLPLDDTKPAAVECVPNNADTLDTSDTSHSVNDDKSEEPIETNVEPPSKSLAKYVVILYEHDDDIAYDLENMGALVFNINKKTVRTLKKRIESADEMGMKVLLAGEWLHTFKKYIKDECLTVLSRSKTCM